MLSNEQIQQLEIALASGAEIGWQFDRGQKPKKITEIRYDYVDPEDLEPIPVPAAFLERGGYIDLNNTDPRDIVVFKISRLF
jgi:hypothetical protein